MTNKYLDLQKNIPKIGDMPAKSGPSLTPEMMNELRAKKNQMHNQMETAEKQNDERRKSVNDLIDKHTNMENKVMKHVEQQSNNQEDQFKRRLQERKDRSISRSLNKSSDDFRNPKTEDTGDKKGAKPFKLYQSNLKFGGGEPPKMPGEIPPKNGT